MKKLITTALLLASGLTYARNSGNMSDKKGALKLPVYKSEYTNINWEAFSNAKPDLQAVKFSGTENAAVHAVFAGTVASVTSFDGKQIVTIQHESYFTVYEGIDAVKVVKGQTVSEGQQLGTVNNADHILTFQMWKEESGTQIKLSPADWLEKK